VEPSRWKKKAFTYLGASLLTSAAAILGTGPLVVLYFNRISLVGFLSNLFLVPLMGLGNTLLSLLTSLFVFISHPLAQILMAVNVFLLNISLALVDFFSRFPVASKRVATPTIPEILLLYGVLIFAVNIKRWRRSIYALIGLVAVFAAIQVYSYYAYHQVSHLAVTFLDVGQADAAVVRFPGGKVMVIDGGGTPDGSFDPGERIVAPFLWMMKNKSVDYMVNSHPHPDHLQGLIFLLENFTVGQVWNNGEEAEDPDIAERFLTLAGERLQTKGREESTQEVGGVRVEFLHPSVNPERSQSPAGNDASLVLRLTFGEVSFLFPGDVESSAEGEILKTGVSLRSTVLKVPHHGSKTSSTKDFLEAVRPRFAVFTVRGGARPRLPNPGVLERYEAMGVKILRSDQHGAITFVTDGKDLRVQTFMGKY
jgi:competence protein ComEC